MFSIQFWVVFPPPLFLFTQCSVMRDLFPCYTCVVCFVLHAVVLCELKPCRPQFLCSVFMLPFSCILVGVDMPPLHIYRCGKKYLFTCYHKYCRIVCCTTSTNIDMMSTEVWIHHIYVSFEAFVHSLRMELMNLNPSL